MPTDLMEIEGSPRPRTYRQKSHRGCTRCKQTRRKCGEEQPTCSLCVKEGRECQYDFDSLFRFKPYNPKRAKGKLEKKNLSKERIRRKSTESQGSCDETLSTISTPQSSSAPDSPIIKEENEDDETTEKDENTLSLCRIYGTPAPPESAVDSFDLPYLNYFVFETPKVHPYASLFPNFVPDLMQMASSVVPLRHSVISLAAIIADTANRKPIVRALLHHQITLQQLQVLLSSVGKIDEATIYAVLTLSWFNLFSGRFLSARRHLRGISVLLQSYSAQGQLPSSTIMLIWRCAVRLDYFLSSVYPCKPVFPAPPPEQEDFHRAWIQPACTPDREEWTIATFALDNLQSRAAHLSWEVYQSRRTGNSSEQQIQSSVTALLNDFATWRQRKVLLDENVSEEFLEGHSPSSPVETFLDHPPMNCRNAFYASLLNEYRCAIMFITYIASPQIGQISPYDTVRKMHAIDSCRSMSATGVTNFPMPMIRILQLAGLVFADPREFPEECAWIQRQLDRVSERGVQAAGKVKEMLGIVWNSTASWTYEETERIMQNEDDLEQLEMEEVYDEVAK